MKKFQTFIRFKYEKFLRSTSFLKSKPFQILYDITFKGFFSSWALKPRATKQRVSIKKFTEWIFILKPH